MRLPERLLKHACALLVVAALPLVAPRALNAATGSDLLGSQPIAVDGAVQASAILELDPAAPMFTERPAQTIRMARGDTLESLASTFHSNAAAMRWANVVYDVSQPPVGTPLLVPPGAGSLVKITNPTSPSKLAAILHIDPRIILDYNALRTDDELPAGRWLQVPRPIAPRAALPSDAVVPDSNGTPRVSSEHNAHGHDTFPYGQCTYYVATRRDVNWVGDAWSWFRNARAAGRPVGQVPVTGSIMVSWDSWVGHVAYVERVFPDGSFLVSEWNVRGWALYDERVISPGKSNIIGFVY